jgi:hypothetical protein
MLHYSPDLLNSIFISIDENVNQLFRLKHYTR